MTRDIEAYAGIATTDTLTFDTTGGGTPQFTLGRPLSYADPNLIEIRDQTGWSGVNYVADGTTVPQAGYSKSPTVTDKVSALRLDFKKQLGDGGWFTDVQFRTNDSERSKNRITDEGLVVADAPTGRGLINSPGNADVESNIGGTGINMLTFDPQADLWPGARLLRMYNDDILSKTWTVTEKVLATYAKANIDTQMAGLPVRGNVGVQIVNTDQSSAGYRAEVGSSVTLSNPAGALRSDGVTYTAFQPTLNLSAVRGRPVGLSAELGSGSILRFGAGQQTARATLTDLRNSFATSVDTNAGNTATFGRFVGSAGNPALKPFKAKALDLSYEKFFSSNKDYVSVAGFYKKLDTYITTSTNIAYDFTTYARQLGLVIPQRGPLGTFTKTVNGNGGNLSGVQAWWRGGVELAASLPPNLVTSVLGGFGVTGSCSNTSSLVKLPNLIGLNPNQQVTYNGLTMPLPGLSKTNTKLMVYSEAYGFSAFVAQTKRRPMWPAWPTTRSAATRR